jgi:hypothetical protein
MSCEKIKKTFEVIVDKHNAGRSAYVLNKIRKEFPDLKISKPKLVTGKLPVCGAVIGSEERGIVFKHKFTEMGSFFDRVSQEVRGMKKRGVRTYNMSWLVYNSGELK